MKVVNQIRQYTVSDFPLPASINSALMLKNQAMVDLGTVDQLFMGGNNAFTWEFQVYLSCLGKAMTLFQQRNSCTQFEGILRIDANGYVIAQKHGSGDHIQAAVPLVPLKWSHVAVTFADSMLRIYIDGELQAEIRANGIQHDPTMTRSLIGASHNDVGFYDYFQGAISYFRIWSEGISEADLKNHNTVTTIQRNCEKLVAHFDFSGLPAKDLGPHRLAMNFSDSAKLILSARGLEMNGSNSYINLHKPDDLSFDNDNPYTVDGWFMPYSAHMGGLFSRFDGDRPTEYRIMYAQKGIDAYRNVGPWNVPSSGGIEPGEWHHFAVSYCKRTRQYAVYQDGKLVHQLYFTTSPSASITEVLIGAFKGRGELMGFFHGMIQRIRVWKDALTPQQIAFLMWQQSDLEESRLLLDCDFSGGVIADKKGHELDNNNCQIRSFYALTDANKCRDTLPAYCFRTDLPDLTELFSLPVTWQLQVNNQSGLKAFYREANYLPDQTAYILLPSAGYIKLTCVQIKTTNDQNAIYEIRAQSGAQIKSMRCFADCKVTIDLQSAEEFSMQVEGPGFAACEPMKLEGDKPTLLKLPQATTAQATLYSSSKTSLRASILSEHNRFALELQAKQHPASAQLTTTDSTGTTELTELAILIEEQLDQFWQTVALKTVGSYDSQHTHARFLNASQSNQTLLALSW